MVSVSATPGAHPAQDALGAVYAAHWTGLVRLAWLLVHDDGLAEDLVQDAFVGTYRHWRGLHDETRAAAYVRRAVVNGCRSALRHRGVQERYAASLAAAPGARTAPSAESTALHQRGDDDLMAALVRLPQRQREVLVLRYFSDLNEAAIADALGIARGSVKAHASRGLAALRTQLSSGGPHE